MIDKNSVLAVIESPKGAMTKEAEANVRRLIHQFKDRKAPVIQVVTVGKEDTGLAAGQADIVVRKRKLSAFFKTDMDIILKDGGFDTVYLCGAYTDVCIRSTAVDAHQSNYHFHVVTDAVCGTTKQAHDCALWNMWYLQHQSIVTTEMVLNDRENAQIPEEPKTEYVPEKSKRVQPGSLEIPANSALILVDVQTNSTKKKLYAEGSTQESDYHRTLMNITEFFRSQKNVPVIHVIEVHRPDLVDFGRELDGSENVHCLETETEYFPGTAPNGQPGDYKIPKRRYSSFFATDLELLLRGCGTKHLFIVGGMTDICVHYTSLEAIEYGYQIHVIREGCNTHTPPQQSQAVYDELEYLQPGCTISMKEIKGLEEEVTGK